MANARIVRQILLLALLILTLQPVVSARTIEFSGITWEVRGWGGNPGNGCWNDGEESVWVDDEGRLHLRIRKVAGDWCQAEVRAERTAQYGHHKFRVIARLDQLDPDTVLGMFLYDPDGEIDIEITGAFQEQANHGWFTIYGQDSDLLAQESFEVLLNGTYTTHDIGWFPNRLDFWSWHGHCEQPPCGGIIHSWTYDEPDRPAAATSLQPRINLWIHRRGEVETEQEVIISSYEYLPLPDRRRPTRRP